jgi:peptidylprolyl isomerase
MSKSSKHPSITAAFTAVSVAAALLLSALANAGPYRSSAEIIAAAQPSDWRNLDPEHTLYLELPAGRVIIELAPAFAPHTVANIETLVKEHYFDGVAVIRAQDNYVVQWAAPDENRKLGSALPTIKAEFAVPIANQPFTLLPDADGYAPQSGFSNGLPAARDPKERLTWLTHCYGMVGVGRDNNPDSGNGAELYAMIGTARLLDRNVTLVGRVLQGIELFSTLPRGTEAMGFYAKPEQYASISSIKLAAQVPLAERTPLQLLRTDTPLFAELLEARRNRHDEWTQHPAGHIDVCSVTVPVRLAPATP